MARRNRRRERQHQEQRRESSFDVWVGIGFLLAAFAFSILHTPS
jgi:hypothetical protein